MTSLKSRRTTNNLLVLAALLLGWLGPLGSVAEAGGRKRIVVLDFEGPKAEKFHDEVVKLIKKNHTVISTEKWNGTAEELDATKLSGGNVKKVAKKLKIDGVISGKVEKRRDEYIVKLKLRNKDGDIVASPDTKWDGPKLDGSALRDVKDELVAPIDALEANRAGGGDDEDEKPAKKVKKGAEDEDEDKPSKKVAKKGEDEDEDKPAKKGFGKKKLLDEEAEDKPAKKVKKGEDEEDKPAKKVAKKERDEDEDSPLPKAKKGEDESEDEDKPAKKKRVSRGEDEDGGSVEEGGDEEDGETKTAMLSPGERAIDFAVGMSFMARRLGFTYSADLGSQPPGYKGAPVAGVLFDTTIYPLAIGHKREGMIKNLGLSVMVDKVIKVSSQYRKEDGTIGTLDSSTMRYAVGGVFRYPFNKTATSPVVGASLRIGGQSFEIGTAEQRTMADIPNVAYTSIAPNVFFKYPATEKITLNVNLGYMAFLGTGEIQTAASYGAATVTGFEGEVSGDYLVTKNIFARAAFRFETIGFKFTGKGDKSTGRDNDPEQDVFGARDSYIGGAVTVGYLY
ncbi:MAG: hypothetical protein H0T79_21120 [Deltaproteobacteria bacterium]|nr:hypothetical protein [Deltaproteobacteria bacterium]